ncbi:MAG: 5-formyltetrahydrofolate cyclo-ligase, partial [Geminicoccaceae bacterium]
LDPRPALFAAIERGAKGALPRTSGPDRPLDFHIWQPEDPLIEGRFKVMEPDPASPKAAPNVLLVPLLAFDRYCRRLGHGKGYYDRTLERLRLRDPSVQAIGVAFQAQEVEAVPVDAFDQTLDMVITEKTVYKAA